MLKRNSFFSDLKLDFSILNIYHKCKVYVICILSTYKSNGQSYKKFNLRYFSWKTLPLSINNLKGALKLFLKYMPLETSFSQLCAHFRDFQMSRKLSCLKVNKTD